ncbi:dynein regulatory complex subunit 4-like [Cololabis saira]|uniref:dynein regulatory complex subunit 4-like n=1 Tax=Cololabis saira TaxID=129043 RepID=UPI002AD29899|nr:dynein regulatory complex subunit 4-like [Cololabis saira]
MPSKKKGTKPAKAKTPTLINGLTMEEMSKEQIEEHFAHLREEVDKEREERNYFQLERDKVDTFGEVADRKLEIINSDKFIEDDEERFQEEIKVYKLKVKHLLCEHENTRSELKANGLVTVELQQKEQDQLETELLKKKRAIVVDMKELNSDELVRELEVKSVEETSNAKNTAERLLTEVVAKYEEKMKVLQHDLEQFGKYVRLEKVSLEAGRILTFKEEHRCTWENRNKYTLPPWRFLQFEVPFKEEMFEDGDMPSVLQDTVSAEPVTKAMEDVVKRTEFSPNKKDSILSHKKDLEDRKLENELMEQKFSKLQLERDELFNSFPQKIQSMQNEAELRNTVLKKKLQALTDTLEKTRAQRSSLLLAPTRDHTDLQGSHPHYYMMLLQQGSHPPRHIHIGHWAAKEVKTFALAFGRA